METYSTETKLLALIATDYLVDEMQFLNMTVNTLIFQMKSGGSKLSVKISITSSIRFSS